MKERYHITGMTCSACSSHVEKSVRKLSGMREVSVNLLTETMNVLYEEDLLTSEGIIAAVEHAGYGAALMERAGVEGRPEGEAGASSDNGMTAERKEFKEKSHVRIHVPYVS